MRGLKHVGPQRLFTEYSVQPNCSRTSREKLHSPCWRKLSAFHFLSPFEYYCFPFSLCSNKECSLQSKIDTSLKHFWRKSYYSWKLLNNSQSIILPLLLHICYYISDVGCDLLVRRDVGKVRAGPPHMLWEEETLLSSSGWNGGGGGPLLLHFLFWEVALECALFCSMLIHMKKIKFLTSSINWSHSHITYVNIANFFFFLTRVESGGNRILKRLHWNKVKN